MENLTIKPSYVSLFSCIGPKCADSCSHDWMMIYVVVSTMQQNYRCEINHTDAFLNP